MELVVIVVEALAHVGTAVATGAVGEEDEEDLVGAQTRTRRKNGSQ